MRTFRPETTAALAAVRAALERARDGTGDVHAKLGRDVVTDTDVAVEDQLRDALGRVAPWPVIGEERGGSVPEDSPYWLVDPICGTRNFASGLPLYAVNVAMVDAGRVVASVVGDGSNGDVLVAELGRGAWRLHGDDAVRLATSASSLVVDVGAWPPGGPARDTAALGLAEAVRRDLWDVRSLATTLSLAYVASGQIAGCVLFAMPGTEHTAAGTLLVAEAGGRVSEVAGTPWELGSASLVCTANEALHAAVLDVVGHRPDER